MAALALVLFAVPAEVTQCKAPGASSTPQYGVASYELMKEEFADQPSILFPDLDRYTGVGQWSYIIDCFSRDRSITGYSAHTSFGSLTKGFAYFGGDSVLLELSVSCSIPSKLVGYYGRPALNDNDTYRNTAVQLLCRDLGETLGDAMSKYPEGAKEVLIKCCYARL